MQNICYFKNPTAWGAKIFLIIRLSFFLILLGLLPAKASIYSQNKTMSIKLANLSMRDALKQIEQESGLHFFMSDNLAVMDELVTIDIKNKSFEQVMDIVLKGHNLSYRIFENDVVVITDMPASKQGITITGTVSDDKGTLPGVNVIIKGTTTGVVTDFDGKYSIDVPDKNAVLVFSFVGFQRREYPVGENTKIDIVLGEETKQLEEVIVVGYGTMKKSDLTGSVASVKGADISQKSSSGTFETLLQGKVAGLQVYNSNSDNPQGGTTVRVRGVSSINGSNAPLVVMDGVPMSDAGGLNAINPNIIESIEVLKDASATAIYGSRGANGVILVTTKRGDKGKANIWFNQKTSFGVFSKKLDYWRDPLLMIDMTDEGRENAGLDPLYIGQKDASGTYYPLRKDVASGAWPYYTRWPDYVFRNTAVTSESNVGIQGGNADNQYFVSLGYYDGQGIQNEDDYDKLSLDLSYENKLTNYLTVKAKSGFFKGNRNLNYGMDYSRNPLYPVYNGDGSYYKMNSKDYGNPLAMTNERTKTASNMDGYATLEFDIDIAKPLQLVLRGNTRAGTSSDNFYNPRIYTVEGDNYNGEGGIKSSSYANLTLDGYLTYSKIFAEDHNFTAMAGVTYESTSAKELNTTGRGFTNDILREENMGGAEEKFITNTQSKTVLASGFTRLNYAYKNRYLFTFTARADGSSKFGDNNKWGFFPSGAVGWRLSEEDFIKNLNFFDHLKLRASYGISGNQGILPYQTISQFGQDYYYANEEEYIIYGVGRQIGREGIGDRYVQWGGMANKDLKWEKTSQWDIGLDMTILKNRLNMTVDYYYKRTDDLLRQQFLNPSTGFDRVWTNDGEVENKGFELAFDGRIISTDKWQFDAGLIFTLNRNEVINIGTKENSGYIEDKNGIKYEPYGKGIMNDAYLNVLAIGYPVNSFYGYEVDGIIQEMPDNPTKLNSPGELNYRYRRLVRTN